MGKDKEPTNPGIDKKKPGAAPTGGATPTPSQSSSSHKGAVGTKVGCHAVGCKAKDIRFNFCEEHFRQYKFGLINKLGEQVLDYDKKFEHYQKWKQAQKVA